MFALFTENITDITDVFGTDFISFWEKTVTTDSENNRRVKMVLQVKFIREGYFDSYEVTIRSGQCLAITNHDTYKVLDLKDAEPYYYGDVQLTDMELYELATELDCSIADIKEVDRNPKIEYICICSNKEYCICWR